MIDASVIVGWLLRATAEDRLNRLFLRGEPVAAPHLIDAEVGHSLRRLNLIGILSTERATAALDDFLSLDLERFPHGDLLERAFALRHNVTVYDALYVALAEALPATLVTMDRALALVPDVRTTVEVIA